jgi:hypothetical protein
VSVHWQEAGRRFPPVKIGQTWKEHEGPLLFFRRNLQRAHKQILRPIAAVGK